jgi:hypothetical protein
LSESSQQLAEAISRTPHPKNKLANVPKSCPIFRRLFAVAFSHTNHHNFTTFTTQNTTFCTLDFVKTPAKTVFHHNQKSSIKYAQFFERVPYFFDVFAGALATAFFAVFFAGAFGTARFAAAFAGAAF